MLQRNHLALGALLGVVALTCTARAQDPDASIQRAPVAPVIDGMGDDAVWNNPNVTAHGLDEFFGVNVVNGTFPDPTNFDITWKALWDDENLYVLVEVFDDVIITGDNNDWQDDSIEFYIDAQDTNSTDFQASANPGTPAYQITGLAGITPELASMEPFNKPLTTSMFTHGTNSYAGDSPPNHYPQGADTSTSVIHDDNNWTLEVAFPWSALFETPANIQQRQEETGLGMGFGLAYNDDDAGAGNGRDAQPMWATDQGDLWMSAVNMPNVFLEGSPSDPIQLQVNTETGEAFLHNPNPEEVVLSKELDGYTISSPSGSLSPSGWNSLDDQGQDGAPGDEFGESWDEVNADSGRLTELFLAGETSLGPLESISLGTIFGGGGGDLTADFNEDGVVDEADLTDPDVGFNDRFGNGEADELNGNNFLNWQRELGQTGGGGGGGMQDLVFEYTDAGITLVGSVQYMGGANQAAVPEPATCLLLAAGMGVLYRVRRRLPAACLLALLATGVVVMAPANAALQHQYTFNDGTADDSQGTAHGTLVDPNGIASSLFGQLNLSANNGANSNSDPFEGAYVDLPNNILSSLGDVVSIETWATVEEQRTWARLWDFGTSDGGEDMSTGGTNSFFVALQPQAGLDGDPVNVQVRDGTFDPVIEVQLNDATTQTSAGVKHHYVLTWDGSTVGSETASLYLDGNLVSTQALGFGITPSLLFDDNNWIGRSQWGDALFDGYVDEVRIYDHALTAQEVTDNAAAGPTAFDGPDPSVTLDRDTREVVISNGGTQALEIKSYSLTSDFGGLDASGWTTILDESTSTENEELAEQKTSGTASVDANDSVNLGAVWIPSPTEDLTIAVTLADDSVWTTSLAVVGNGGASFARSDLDFDGSIGVGDYAIFTGGMFDDLSALSGAEAYGQGDLNGDGVNNLDDYNIFKSDFIAAQGEAAFAALVNGVPEPSTMVLLALSGLALLGRRRAR